MTIFARSPLCDVIWELEKILNVLDHISKNIVKKYRNLGLIFTEISDQMIFNFRVRTLVETKL